MLRKAPGSQRGNVGTTSPNRLRPPPGSGNGDVSPMPRRAPSSGGGPRLRNNSVDSMDALPLHHLATPSRQAPSSRGVTRSLSSSASAALPALVRTISGSAVRSPRGRGGTTLSSMSRTARKGRQAQRGHSPHSVGSVVMDGEKGAKLQQLAKSRMQSMVMLLLLLGVMCLVTAIKLNHNHDVPRDMSNSGLRSSRRQMDMFGTNKYHRDTNEFIPPISLYDVSVRDSNQKMVSLGKYRGLVTLVVNVACL